jgi:hypothetical protein
MPGIPESDPASSDGAAGLVIGLADDLATQECALDAELMLSTLLGAVYAVTTGDRGRSQTRFEARLAERAKAAGSTAGHLLGALLDAWNADAAGPAPDPAVPGAAGLPAWLPLTGRVRVTGSYAYGDRYGDQTGYVATFAYDDERLGGPEHAVLVVADHNAGHATDVLITAPAEEMVHGLRDAVAADPDAMSWFARTPPATVRAAATAYLRLADLAATPPDDSLATNRALALARLALLPAPAATAPAPANGRVAADAAARGRLVEEFLADAGGDLTGLPDPGGESVRYCADLIVDFAATARAGDPLRWSPSATGVFLLDWVHTRAVLDPEDVETMPVVLAAWARWSGRRLGLPAAAVARTVDAVAGHTDRFRDLCASGERQSEAARAVAGMVAAGLDPDDPGHVVAWLDREQGGE